MQISDADSYRLPEPDDRHQRSTGSRLKVRVAIRRVTSVLDLAAKSGSAHLYWVVGEQDKHYR